MSFLLSFVVGIITGSLIKGLLDRRRRRRIRSRVLPFLLEPLNQPALEPAPHTESLQNLATADFPVPPKETFTYQPGPVKETIFHRRRKLIGGVLIIATALIHLSVGAGDDLLLLSLNGLGYLGWLVLYLLPLTVWQRHIRISLIGYTAISVVAYFILHGRDGLLDPLGLVTKLIEIGLMVHLWLGGSE